MSLRVDVLCIDNDVRYLRYGVIADYFISGVHHTKEEYESNIRMY